LSTVPEAHWPHLRTTNVVESPFASVRLRTNAAKRFKKTKSGVYLVHQVMLRLEHSWRRLISAHLCGTVPLPGQQAETKADVAYRNVRVPGTIYTGLDTTSAFSRVPSLLNWYGVRGGISDGPNED
jgi:hypothetical protein